MATPDTRTASWVLLEGFINSAGWGRSNHEVFDAMVSNSAISEHIATRFARMHLATFMEKHLQSDEEIRDEAVRAAQTTDPAMARTGL